MGVKAGRKKNVVEHGWAQQMKACRPLAEDSTKRDRQSQTSIIPPRCLHQPALGTALLAAWVLVAVGFWPDWKESPDFGGSGVVNSRFSARTLGPGLGFHFSHLPAM